MGAPKLDLKRPIATNPYSRYAAAQPRRKRFRGDPALQPNLVSPGAGGMPSSPSVLAGIARMLVSRRQLSALPGYDSLRRTLPAGVCGVGVLPSRCRLPGIRTEKPFERRQTGLGYHPRWPPASGRRGGRPHRHACLQVRWRGGPKAVQKMDIGVTIPLAADFASRAWRDFLFATPARMYCV